MQSTIESTVAATAPNHGHTSDLTPTQPVLMLVAGGPGAGKTVIGRALARAIPTAMLLDKDVVASPWLDPLLARLNRGAVDRDSAVYWDELRPLEYASLFAAAYDNLGVGKTAIVVAPLAPELRDREWVDGVRARADACAARLAVLWIAADEADARERMIARNDTRDAWKLAHWDAFNERNPYAAPAPMTHVDWLVLHNHRSSRIDDLVEHALQWVFR
jgi:predicted kinase